MMSRMPVRGSQSSQILRIVVPFCALGLIGSSLLAQNNLGQPNPTGGGAAGPVLPQTAIAEPGGGIPTNSISTKPQPDAPHPARLGLSYFEGQERQEPAADVGEAIAESGKNLPVAPRGAPDRQPSQNGAMPAVPRAESSIADPLHPTAIANAAAGQPPAAGPMPAAPQPIAPLPAAPAPAPNSPTPLPGNSAPPVSPAPALRGAEQIPRPAASAYAEGAPIGQLQTNIGVTGPVPDSIRTNCTLNSCIARDCLGTATQPPCGLDPRVWTPLCYCWEAPSLCYGPLYFEETNLERFGYSQTYLRTMQPLVSSAQFFGTSFILPYLLVAEPPCECVYTLGEYRPGSCVPFRWNYPYFSPACPWQKSDQ
jgi:hypothetical protein